MRLRRVSDGAVTVRALVQLGPATTTCLQARSGVGRFRGEQRMLSCRRCRGGQGQSHRLLRRCPPRRVAILDGSRDPALATDPALSYADAVELTLLLEQL